MPWIQDNVDDKIQAALGTNDLKSICIDTLDCKSWIANEFLDILCSYVQTETSLEKIIFKTFMYQCEPFTEEVMTRLTKMCPSLSQLQLSAMSGLTEEGRLSMAILLRQIIQKNSPIRVLNL